MFLLNDEMGKNNLKCCAAICLKRKGKSVKPVSELSYEILTPEYVREY
jgi:hypothetical protein